jgi:hypothetical protein
VAMSEPTTAAAMKRRPTGRLCELFHKVVKFSWG